ncbi:DNA helicase MCM8 isoform X1 [Phascolarctos cinereus]|uniref:DNA helicase MCM8 n=1 Tax=Phascolarctos cinereus TaxID=38626 RepID=A0A6P5K8J6_PHACI|nr:DNA helicase MCM8 isoform X1 [Phascolarctos cinereus]XP_020841198.1 DNA helicase MCM8 isoform X1 [Phascolarctos cinereus]XP_020841206.1 DNA helicase MCM8 isoform X1 [Phascolarctos cinereus]XP_020841212.1 DNA helicase MCM8 isoform X1 [Phascolarctos cinereus]XP_020841217.1 DNA helicase MCM8 isoform X1 [Phascolarctos cinereus]XP_020841224.1 DNA helicase MCM8 isoform X1 [Phascolarctos cinereus]
MSANFRGRGFGRGGFQSWRRGRGSWGSGRGRGKEQRNDGKKTTEKHVSLQNPEPWPRQSTLDQFIPYKGWKFYFSEVYSDSSPFVQKIQAFENFFTKHIELYDKDEIERKGSILVDYKELTQDDALTNLIPNIATELRDMPEKTLACMGLAIHQILTKDLERHAAELQAQEGLSSEGETIVNVPHIIARVYNYDSLTQLKNVRANCYGKYIALRGTVVRVSNIKPLCTKMAFLCAACGEIQSFSFPDGKYSLPTKCPVPVCHGKTFTALRSSPLTVTVDWQSIKIQELMSDDQREAGRIPRTIECELVQDLVDSCVPGDIVTITGIVKVSNTEEGSRNKNDKCMFLLYIEANSVSNSKGQKTKISEDGANYGTSMEFSLKDLYAIQEIQSEENLFKLIVNSLCPVIFGHELVKAGLALALFGGCQKYVDDKNRIPVRGDPHILVVGDPGLGKSQMLQAVCSVAPRGVYVCGNTTTSSGLTVTLSKDSASGDFALEAGALVLGDQGICGIDEFDKMGNQHQALLEAMEQQSISLAKAGIVCNLPARTSIIAAANPVGGHYNKAKTVSENLKIGSALLSRFDLVFILLDTPNEDYDHLLSEHVMAIRAGKKKTVSSATVSRMSSQDSNTSLLEVVSDKPLSERLKVSPGENLDPIPHHLLRKYVGYSRQYVHPKLSPEAAQILQDFYLELRKQTQRLNGTPITTRQLESLIRLTEARTRLELREKATKEDAEDIVEIMKYSMLGTYSDEFGNLDFERSQHGSGMSNRSAAKRFISALNTIAERTYNNLFQYQQLRQISKELNIQVADFENFISSLNDQGYLLKKGPKVYQLQTM